MSSIGLFSCDKTVEKTPTSTKLPTLTDIEIVDYTELIYSDLNRLCSEISVGMCENYDNDNISVSPISIINLLSMIMQGCDYETSNKIASYFDTPSNKLSDYLSQVIVNLDNENFSDEIYYDENGKAHNKLSGELNNHNSFWYEQTNEINRYLTSSLMKKFDVEVFKVDFKNDSSTVSEYINNYIKEKTNNLINLDLKYTNQTQYTLLNCLYLSDVWSSNSLKYTEEEYTFTNSDGNTTNTKLLESLYNSGKVVQLEEFKHFYIRSANGYKVKFIIPNEGKTIDDVFTAENISLVNEWKNYSQYEIETAKRNYTKVYFPKFSTSFNEEIINYLNYHFDNIFKNKKLFSNILSNVDTSIDKVIHATNLSVDEVGLSGAAVSVTIDYIGAPIGMSFTIN